MDLTANVNIGVNVIVKMRIRADCAIRRFRFPCKSV